MKIKIQTIFKSGIAAIIAAIFLSINVSEILGTAADTPIFKHTFLSWSQLWNGFQNFNALSMLIFYVIVSLGYTLYLTYPDTAKRRRYLSVGLAVVFGFLATYGEIYSVSLSANYYWLGLNGPFASLYVLLSIGWSLALFPFIDLGWRVLMGEFKPLAKNLEQLRSRKFWWQTFALIFSTQLIASLIFYPGILQSDTLAQIAKHFQIPYASGHQVARAIHRNPEFTTWLYTSVLSLSKSWFKTYTVGIYAAVLIQLTALSAALATVLSRLREWGVPKHYIQVVWFIYAFLPYWWMTPQVVIGDVLYTAGFVWWLILLMDELRANRFVIERWLMLLLSSILLVNLRDYVIWIVAPTLILASIHRCTYAKIWQKIKWWLLGAGILTAGLIVWQAPLPLLVNSGFTQPYQQSAYLLNQKTLSTTHRKALSQTIKQPRVYQPEVSDPIMYQVFWHRQSLSKQERNQQMKRFNRHYLQVVSQHPQVVWHATLLQNYRIWSPANTDYQLETLTTTKQHYRRFQSPIKGLRRAHLAPDKWQKQVGQFAIAVTKIWPFAAFTNPGVLTWLVIWLLLAAIYRRNTRALLAVVPLLLVVAENLVAPANGLLRYMMPVSASIFLLIGFILSTLQTDRYQRNYGKKTETTRKKE